MTTAKKSMATSSSQGESKQVLDIQIFNQILDMDEDPPRREFSSSIIDDFFNDVGQVLISMEEALDLRDLPTLACLGERVKGTAATLGLERVSESGRKIHAFGFKRSEDGASREDDDDVCLDRIHNEINVVKHEIAQARRAVDILYGLNGSSEEQSKS